jgi:hypothetical protein
MQFSAAHVTGPSIFLGPFLCEKWVPFIKGQNTWGTTLVLKKCRFINLG